MINIQKKTFIKKVYKYILFGILIAAHVLSSTVMAFSETVDCLAPELTLESLRSNNMMRFLQVNAIKINPDKQLPSSITLRNMADAMPFTLKRDPRNTIGMYHIFLDGRFLPESQVIIRETDREIKIPSIYLNGSDYSVTRKGIGKTILTYLSIVALSKGKDLVISDTQNYGLMHLCWSCLSSKIRYYQKVHNNMQERSFDNLAGIVKSNGIAVEVSSPSYWSGLFEPGADGEFLFMEDADDIFAKQISVRMLEDKTISAAWRDEALRQQPLEYIVQTNILVDKMVVPLVSVRVMNNNGRSSHNPVEQAV